MCGIEGAAPYIALAILCPAAYEGMARAKLGQLLGSSSETVRPHVDGDDRAGQGDG